MVLPMGKAGFGSEFGEADRERTGVRGEAAELIS